MNSLTLCAVLGCALIAGVFFAFSTFVMPALARLQTGQGIAAMQSINITVLNRWFLGALMGTAAACLVLAALSVANWHAPYARLRLLGCVFYLVGTIGVTGACNVPRNEALAVLRAEDGDAEAAWRSYVAEWTSWNHVRTAAGFTAAALLAIALMRPSSPSSEDAERTSPPGDTNATVSSP
ncbi:DUF1772 domain-containing protein [Labilithrix luteola]|uniref:anthrone oxygenase family protein n=1 Tax=Labilithrix luteola TaxID=1391654 RepID=UPI001F0AB7B3|nr:anthrone oxygenase family protein [Labilithrix luteola]